MSIAAKTHFLWLIVPLYGASLMPSAAMTPAIAEGPIIASRCEIMIAVSKD
jgi:hypothetical protein